MDLSFVVDQGAMARVGPELRAHLRRLITSREIYPIYDKWFNNPIPPNNTVLNLPVSYLLRDFWKYPTDQVPF